MAKRTSLNQASWTTRRCSMVIINSMSARQYILMPLSNGYPIGWSLWKNLHKSRANDYRPFEPPNSWQHNQSNLAPTLDLHSSDNVIHVPLSTIAASSPVSANINQQALAHSTTVHDTPILISTQVGIINTTDDPKKLAYNCTECDGRSYGRTYDFERHYRADHAPERIAFWCPVSGCTRSRGSGNKPFRRKDLMTKHRRNMHGIRS